MSYQFFVLVVGRLIVSLCFAAVTSGSFDLWWIFIIIAVILLLLILLLCCCLCCAKPGDSYKGASSWIPT
jgi:cell division protein FtsW (lipid II flippase)